MTPAESLLLASVVVVTVSVMGFLVTLANAVMDWLDEGQPQ
jgi:hypothetical protein